MMYLGLDKTVIMTYFSREGTGFITYLSRDRTVFYIGSFPVILVSIVCCDI